MASEEPCWEVRSVPGKGLGLFATRRLSAGDLVLREQPLLVMPASVFDSDEDSVAEDWLDKHVNRLSAVQREIFFDLSDSRSPGQEKAALGIFYTNDMDFGGDAGLFPVMARANHSCTPNADFITRQSLGVQDLVATRDICAGDEITLSYLPAGNEGSDIVSVRQHYIRHWYGFRCCCVACTMQGPRLAENELFRSRVRAAQQSDLFSLSPSQLEQLLSDLWRIGAKLPYRLEVARAALARGMEAGDRLVAARAMAEVFLLEDIVQDESEEKTRPTEMICVAGVILAVPS